MVRFFITMLMLVIFFLGGMVLGIGHRDNDTATQRKMDVEQVVVKEPIKSENEQKNVTTKEMSTNPSVEMDTKPHFTQKAAGFLEEVMKGFYHVIILVMYQVTKIFF